MKKTPKTSEQATADRSNSFSSVGETLEGAHTKTVKNPVEKNQDSPEHNPDLAGQTNPNTVNPVAPKVYPDDDREMTERQTATPDAKNEPTWNK